MQEGSSSPWGKIQHVTQLAPGAWSVSTAGHGGIKLDATRNRRVPKGARQPGGWYEEDCQWAIAAYVHADVGDAMLKGARESNPEKYAGTAYLVETISYWEHPDVCTALGLTKATPGWNART